MVRSPSIVNRSWVTGPTPGIARTDSGANVEASAPGGTTRTPLGLASSLATLAISLDVPMPTEAVNPRVRRDSSVRIRSANPANASTSPVGASVPSKSTNASSRLSACTRSDTSPSRAITMRLDCQYASNRPPRKAACGASALASWPGIAERTPNALAS